VGTVRAGGELRPFVRRAEKRRPRTRRFQRGTVEIRIPPGVAWPVHRVATSGRYQDSLHTILTEWSIADVWDANDVLDAMEDAERRAWDER
jgi:hypothetical protein